VRGNLIVCSKLLGRVNGIGHLQSRLERDQSGLLCL
jgi:hypothetical protein